MRVSVYRKTRKWMVADENFTDVIVDHQPIEDWIEQEMGDYPGVYEQFKLECSAITADGDLCIITT